MKFCIVRHIIFNTSSALHKMTPTRQLMTTFSRQQQCFEPPYLHNTVPKPAEYPLVNIQVKGYDYTVLQSYQSWVDRTCRNMGLTVNNAWATPCQNLNVTRLKKKSDVVMDTFNLNVYERNVQLAFLPASTASVLLEALVAGLPQGVQLSVHEHMTEHEQVRYIPNKELKELRQQLDDVGKPVLKAKTFTKKK